MQKLKKKILTKVIISLDTKFKNYVSEENETDKWGPWYVFALTEMLLTGFSTEYLIWK